MHWRQFAIQRVIMEADGKLRIPGLSAGHFDAARAFRVVARSPGCIRIFATLTVLVGVLGQLIDVLNPSNGPEFTRVHAAFGSALLLTFLARVFREEGGEAGVRWVDEQRFQQALKRSVYLLLYGLALFKESLIVGFYLWRGGAITLGRLVIGRHVINTAVGMEMSDDFGIYLVLGAAAIALSPMAVALRSR